MKPIFSNIHLIFVMLILSLSSIGLSLDAKANDKKNEFELRVGLLDPMGARSAELNQLGYGIFLGFRPSFFDAIDNAFKSTQLPLIQDLSLAFDLNYLSFSGNALSRSTSYIGPGIGPRWTKVFGDKDKITGSLMYGLGLTQVSRSGASASGVTSLVQLNGAYHHQMNFGTLGAGIETGWLADSSKILTYIGGSIMYSYSF